MVSRLTKLKGILRGAFLFVHSIVRTAMQRVYRLETLEGVGVYMASKSNQVIQRIMAEYFDAPRHPGPMNDSLLTDAFCSANRDRFSFGFASIEQLKEWFFDDNDRELLSLHGIVCNEYEIEGWGFVAGRKQCMFVKENARLVGQVDFI